MSWVKSSDDSAFNPVVLAPVEHPAFDDRLLNEVYGFVMRCATQSGAHLTDYIVSRGTAMQVAGPSRLDVLLEVGIFAGYLTVVEVDGRTAYKIIDDPNFIHLRSREEVEWERIQRRDSADVSLRIPVRFRDGDACRYCAKAVDWDARTGNIGGTYDHLEPLNPNTTVDTFVVACRTCNSARKRGDTSFPLALRLPPLEPYYSPSTRKMFQENVWAKSHGYVLPPSRRKAVAPGTIVPGVSPAPIPEPGQSHAPEASSSATVERPATQAEHAQQESREHSAPAATPGDNDDTNTLGQRSGIRSEHAPKPLPTSGNEAPAEVLQNPQEPADAEGSYRYGPGRVGPGRVGSGAAAPTPPQVPPRRTRRGRRKRSTTTRPVDPQSIPNSPKDLN